MHPAKILGIIAISLAFGLVASAADKLEQFELKVHGLELMLKAETNIPKRYNHFLKIHKELLELKKSPRGAENEELSISLFLDTLKDLPAKKNFSAKKCPEYIQKSKTMMTGSQGQEQDLWITRGLQLIELICKK